MTRTKVLLFGFMTALLASGYGVMFTVLDDFRDEYGIQAGDLGVIVGIGFFTSFASQVLLAPISDRGYARRMVVLGMSINIVGLIGMATGSTLLELLLARLISGIGMGIAIPAVRRIVVNGDPGNLGKNLGLLLSADVTGFAAGPALAAALVPRFGIGAPFLTIAALTTVCIPLIFWLPVVEQTPDRDNPPARFAFDLLRNRALVSGLMMGAAVFLMIGTFDALWAIVLDDLDASEFIATLGITVFALPLIFLGSTGGSLAQRVGPFRLGPVGLMLGAVFLIMYGLMPTGGAMLAVGIVHSLSDGLTIPSAGVAVGTVAPPERQAGAQGMLGAAETLTGGVAAVLAGELYEVGGRLLAYSVAAGLMIALALGAWWLAGPQHRARPGRPVDFDADLEPVTTSRG